MTNYPAGKQLVEGGHVFKTEADDPDEIEIYDSPGYHGGPQCVVCKHHECSWCREEFLTERCDEAVVETLPGLEFA